MKRKLKTSIVVVAAMAAVFMVTSCDKREPVDMQGVSGEQTENEYKVSTEKGDIKEQLGIEDSWEETLVSNNQRDVNVYAKVIVPSCSGMKIYKGEAADFGAEAAEQYISAGEFDELFYMDEENIPKEIWRERLENKKAEWMNNRGGDLSELALSNSEVDVEYAAAIEELEQRYNNAPDDYKVAEAYDGYCYLGMKNNHRFEITNYQTEFGWNPLDYNWAAFVEGQSKGDYVNAFYGSVYDKNDAGTNNKCSIPHEDVESVAYQYLEHLGLSEYKITEAKELSWEATHGDETKSWNDGYTVEFTRTTDGIEVANSGTGISVNAFDFEVSGGDIEIERIEPVWSDDKIRLLFNDEGILAFQHRNPVTITDVVAGNVELLDFEQIKELFRLAIQNSSTQSVVSLKQLELKYIMLYNPDNEEEFTIIPAWFLSDGKGAWTEACIVLNAVSGSLILQTQ